LLTKKAGTSGIPLPVVLGQHLFIKCCFFESLARWVLIPYHIFGRFLVPALYLIFFSVSMLVC